MFKKLRETLSFAPTKTQDNYTLPFGLTESEYKKLQRLVDSEDFALLQKTLDNAITLYGEQLLGASDEKDVHFLRGKILGIRFSVEFVDSLRYKEQDFLINERRHSAERNPGKQARSLFGTPAWKPQRPSGNGGGKKENS